MLLAEDATWVILTGSQKILRQMLASMGWVDHGQNATSAFQFHGYGINLGMGESPQTSPLDDQKICLESWRQKPGPLRVSCFFSCSHFPPRGDVDASAESRKVTGKDNRETQAQRWIFHDIILLHQNRRKHDSCLHNRENMKNGEIHEKLITIKSEATILNSYERGVAGSALLIAGGCYGRQVWILTGRRGPSRTGLGGERGGEGGMSGGNHDKQKCEYGLRVLFEMQRT